MLFRSGALNDARSLACALGETLTEPKAIVWFQGGEPLSAGAAVRLDARSRMMYDDHHVFINGESFRAAGKDARLMRRLADDRALPASAVAQLSEGALALLPVAADRQADQVGGLAAGHVFLRAHRAGCAGDGLAPSSPRRGRTKGGATP